MNIKHGVQPVKRDRRDYSFHRTFPHHSQRLGGASLPIMIYNYDAGFGMPDQNADGLPNGCTGYAQSELCQDQDRTPYSARYTYDQTLALEHAHEGVGCDIRDSLSTLLTPGPSNDGGKTSAPRKGYFRIEKAAGYDWFDSLRIALRAGFNEKRSISIASPWFPEFEQTGPDGIVSPVMTGNPANLPWHDHKISGETLKGQLPFLCDKSWQGDAIGDRGWLYFGRDQINNLLAINNTAAYVVTKTVPQDVQTVVLYKYEYLFVLLRKMITLFTLGAL